MREKQMQALCSFTAKMTNSKYVNEKKKLGNQLKLFRNFFNYNKISNFMSEQEL
ncbi:MAG TPA: hypothetical protein P5556_08165 [Candidatus Gastranaerophilales bacterium]|nr:hypothetical protein [Candidatus Gastranaerophilales bacterium]